MSKGTKLLDERLPTTLVSRHQLAALRKAAQIRNVSVAAVIRNSIDEHLSLQKAA